MDPMTAEPASIPLCEPSSWRARWLAALAIGAAYWLVSHSLTESKVLQAEANVGMKRTENEYAVRQKETNANSVVGFSLIGATGLVCWVLAPPGRLRWNHPLLLLCLGYAAFCVASVMWSVEPAQTFRKSAILGLMMIGAFGMAAKFEIEDLLWITMIVMLGYFAIGVLAEAACGTLRPWHPGYRFGGTVHPNDQGLQCALLVLAAWLAEGAEHDRPWLRRAIMLVGTIGLLATGSRTTLAALLFAACIALALKARGINRWLTVAGFIVLAAVGGVVYTFVPVSALKDSAEVASLGRSKDVSSLSGRLPLWEQLTREIKAYPTLGHGYGAFWGSKNILKYSDWNGWHIPHAHNAYLDLLLAVGAVGLVVYLAWTLASMAVAIARYEKSGRTAELFAVCLFAFSLVHGISESKMPGAEIGGFLMLASLVMLAVQPPRLSWVADARPPFAESRHRWRWEDFSASLPPLPGVHPSRVRWPPR